MHPDTDNLSIGSLPMPLAGSDVPLAAPAAAAGHAALAPAAGPSDSTLDDDAVLAGVWPAYHTEC